MIQQLFADSDLFPSKPGPSSVLLKNTPIALKLQPVDQSLYFQYIQITTFKCSLNQLIGKINYLKKLLILIMLAFIWIRKLN